LRRPPTRERLRARPVDLDLEREAAVSSDEWLDPQSPPGQADSALMRSISAKNSMKPPGRTGLAFMK